MDYFEAHNLFAGLFLRYIFNILRDVHLLFEQSWGLIFAFTEKSNWQHLFVRDLSKKGATWDHQLVFWLRLCFLFIRSIWVLASWFCVLSLTLPLSADCSCRDGFLLGTAASSPTNASWCIFPFSLKHFLFRNICRYFDVLVLDHVGYTDNRHSLSLNLHGTNAGCSDLCSGSACIGCLDPRNRSCRGGGTGNALYYCGEELCLGGGEERGFGVSSCGHRWLSVTPQLNWTEGVGQAPGLQVLFLSVDKSRVYVWPIPMLLLLQHSSPSSSGSPSPYISKGIFCARCCCHASFRISAKLFAFTRYFYLGMLHTKFY